MPVPVPRQRAVSAAETTHGPDLTLLVISDDAAGTFTVPELSSEGGTRVRVRTARNLTEADRLLTDHVDCVLLDLDLAPPTGTRADSRPDGDTQARDELATLQHVLRIAPRHAVLALTAEDDAERAAEAVRVGAQDYLYRGSSTDASSAAPSGTPWNANAPTSPSTS